MMVDFLSFTKTERKITTNRPLKVIVCPGNKKLNDIVKPNASNASMLAWLLLNLGILTNNCFAANLKQLLQLKQLYFQGNGFGEQNVIFQVLMLYQIIIQFFQFSEHYLVVGACIFGKLVLVGGLS
jgi:hypothetical protein